MAVHQTTLSFHWVRTLLAAAGQTRVLVVGDVMLDQFIWGASRASRRKRRCRWWISPGRASCPAARPTWPATWFRWPRRRNFSAPSATTMPRGKLQNAFERAKHRLRRPGPMPAPTSIKTRIVAHQQQVVRVDRETRDGLNGKLTAACWPNSKASFPGRCGHHRRLWQGGRHAAACWRRSKSLCHARGVWLSLDPKPVHHLDLSRFH